MTDVVSTHSAAPSYLGYAYQGLYALCLLLGADDDAAISIETWDDVVLHNSATNYTLHQLKYTINQNPISIASEEVWRTFNAWLDVPNFFLSPTITLILATVAPLASNSPLNILVSAGQRSEQAVSELIAALDTEAGKVIAARNIAKLDGKKNLPYEHKFKGCTKYLSLSPDQKAYFISRIKCCPSQGNMTDLHSQVKSQLSNHPRRMRDHIKHALIGWWDFEVARCLISKDSPRLIDRSELTEKIFSFAREIEDERLSSDVSGATPPSHYALNDIATRQIRCVSDRDSIIKRSKDEEWRARTQRSMWLDRDVAFVNRIRRYDAQLLEEWQDRHSEMKDNLIACGDHKSEDACRRAGYEILNWTHRNAPNEISPIDNHWREHYLVRGTYQILSGDLHLGWHPFWTEIFKRELEVNCASCE